MALLDGVFESLATTLTGTLGSVVVFKQTVSQYDHEHDTELLTNKTVTTTSSPPDPYKVNQIDGSLVQGGDLKIIVAAAPFRTASINPIQDGKNWTVTLQAKVYQVIRWMPLNSGGQDAAYEVQLRN